MDGRSGLWLQKFGTLWRESTGLHTGMFGSAVLVNLEGERGGRYIGDAFTGSCLGSSLEYTHTPGILNILF